MNISGDIPHAGIDSINIPLKRRNLIITGKNGSGKTSFLNLVADKIKIHLKKEAQVKDQAEEQIIYWTNRQNDTQPGSYEFSQAQFQIDHQNKRLSKINEGLKLDFINEY
ncbi:ATP-binding protein, partial [Acinetobacter baumannii]|nr:ATP-binding protein [Acinetobacter baumannii]